jgi:hypothetical protein
LHTPHVPPSLAQCLQYLQFLQALHGLLPVQVANDEPAITKASKVQTKAIGQNLLARMTASWKDGQNRTLRHEEAQQDFAGQRRLMPSLSRDRMANLVEALAQKPRYSRKNLQMINPPVDQIRLSATPRI